jgi:hypothetical protein
MFAMPRAVRATSLTVSLLAAVAVAAPAGAAAHETAKPISSTHMYGKRYCEYLIVTGKLPDLTGSVWNTYGLNTCPQKLWDATDAATLAKQQNALAVLKNGPRFWLIDRVKLWKPGKVQDFNGLKMRFATSFVVPITNGKPGQAPYTETTINRHTTFTWPAGKTIHELLAPNGRRYAMQAYSEIVDPKLKLSQLSGLGSRLKLPTGWKYRNRKLKKPLALTTVKSATIIQDELQNTYQREK